MAKNILIFSDGTGQAGGLRPDQTLSNVYKLYRATRTGVRSTIDPKEQFTYYSAGLGSGENEGAFWEHPIKSIRKIMSSAMGAGIAHNIADCYEAILKSYQPGDRIYLFGFSRGAYTVRNVAGVLNLCGIPTCNANGEEIPLAGKRLRQLAEEAVQVYEHGASKERKLYEAEREELARRFRAKYASNEVNCADEQQKSNVAPYFIGVFDTVAALGVSGMKRWGIIAAATLITLGLSAAIGWLVSALTAWSWLLVTEGVLLAVLASLVMFIVRDRLKIFIIDPNRSFPSKYCYRQKGRLLPKMNFTWHIESWRFKYFDRYLDNRVQFARHALSIDEQRKDFARVPWGVKGEKAAKTHKDEPEWFKQVWFAGNHSDIGGSYPETESRLSDISLQWMVEQIKELPYPAIIENEKLNTFPDATGMQHSEIFSMKNKFPSWWPAKLQWARLARPILPQSPLHPTVLERFEADKVQQSDICKPYRPENLKDHEQVKVFYNS